MKLIQTKTLESISHHKNKVIRLASYLLESESDYIIQKMGEVTPESNITDVVSAINQDLANTAKFVGSLAKVMQTVDENDVSTELDNGETDFKKIFPNHYKDGQIEVFGVNLSRVNGAGILKADDIKQRIFRHAFPDHSFEDFKSLVKLVNKAAAQGEVTPDMSFEIRLARVSHIHAVEAFKPFVKDVLGSAEKNFQIRMQMSDKDKMTIDQKVMGGRAMIDGVTLASTYINKTDGIVQVSSTHKGQQNLLNQITVMVKELPYLKGVEVDPDTDLQKFHDMVESLKSMSFSNSDPFELKSRKLGNYGASGINVVTDNGQTSLENLFGYANNMLRIVAVDVRTPTSLAHEIAHYSDTELNAAASIRSDMVRHFGAKIDYDLLTELYGDKTAGYIMNNREIVARLGEIGFGLHQIGYEPGDDVDTVLRKSKEWELNGINAGENNKFSVAIVKNMEVYMAKGVHSNDTYKQEIYFNMASWTPEELTMVKDFTQGFYFDMQPDVQQALKERLKEHQTRLTTLTKMQARRISKRRVRALSEQDIRQKVWGVLKHDNDILGKLLEIGKKERLFEDGEFSYYATVDLSTLFAGSTRKNSLDRGLISLQYENYENLAKKASDIGAVAELSVLKYGAGLMAEAISQNKRFSTTNPEVKFLLSRIGGTNDESPTGIDPTLFLKMRATAWNTLSSDSQSGIEWRKSIRGAYDAATEGFNLHADGASLEDAYPLSQIAFLGNYLVEKGLNSEPLPNELFEQIVSDNFNLGVIAFSDEDRLAHRVDELALSVPHQELFDTSHFLFKLGDNHVEASLAKNVIESGLFEELGIDESFIRKHIRSERFSELKIDPIKITETVPEYLDRIENQTYSQPVNQNYHDHYGRVNEKVTYESKRYITKMETISEPMRTSPLLILSNLVQEKAGVEGTGKFINAVEKAMSESTRFQSLLEVVAKSNIAQFNYVNSNVRDGRQYGFGGIAKMGTPESLFLENMGMKQTKLHKDSKVIDVTPTDMMKAMLQSKLVSDIVAISNPSKDEPMCVRAVKLNAGTDRMGGVRIIPTGDTPNAYFAQSTVLPMTAVNRLLGEIAAKVNTPAYEKELYVDRNEGREAAIEFQKVLTVLEGAIGSKAYEVFNFPQKTALTQMPYSDKEGNLHKLWGQMNNYLIQNHRDTFVPVADLVQECEMVHEFRRSAENTRERVEALELRNESPVELPSPVPADIKVEIKPENTVVSAVESKPINPSKPSDIDVDDFVLAPPPSEHSPAAPKQRRR